MKTCISILIEEDFFLKKFMDKIKKIKHIGTYLVSKVRICKSAMEKTD